MRKKKKFVSGKDVIKKRRRVSPKANVHNEIQEIEDALVEKLKNYQEFFNYLLKPEEDELDLEFND